MNDLLIKDLIEHFSYDDTTGLLIVKKKYYNRLNVGDVPGTIHPNGYRRILFKGRLLYAHRIAWAMHYIESPPDEIDHINGIPIDNRICNLRKATHTENCRNSRMKKRNTSGYKGVIYDKERKKWRAECAGKYIGRFDTAEKASEAYWNFAKIKFGEFATPN